MRYLTILLALVLATGCGGPAGALSGDVVAYRGDSARTGVMPGPGPSGEPGVVWQFQADAPIGSSPTVRGGTVFVVSEDGIVHALRLATGAERWRHPSPRQEDMYAPAVIDGRAYIVAEDETVVAVDAATGAELWSATTGAPVDALPAVWGSVLYVATDGDALQARDTADGKLRWQSPIVGGPYAPIVTGGFVLVGTNSGALFAIGDVTP